MSEEAARVLAYAVRRVVVNRVVRNGDRWLKRRVPGSTAVIATGNVYLRRAGRFTLLVTPSRWARHEVEVYRALYGENAAGFLDAKRVWMAHTPGITLTDLVQRGASVRALQATGAELRRVHATNIAGKLFSHGDLHLANVLFCAEGDRARLIDFETVHTDDQDARARHVDDLACLAFDLAATSPRPATDWAAFLRGYAPEGELRGMLAAKLASASFSSAMDPMSSVQVLYGSTRRTCHAAANTSWSPPQVCAGREASSTSARTFIDAAQ